MIEESDAMGVPSEASSRPPSSPPKRRARRIAPRTGSTTRAMATRRRRESGADTLQALKASVDELIKENRKLKRQVERLQAKSPTAAKGAGSLVERGLRSIQRRAQRALVGAASPTRRRRVTTTKPRSSTAPRRRRTPPSTPS